MKDLLIKSVEYYNFRNYSHYTLNNLRESNLFIGPNAIGKTNLIEGIQLITALYSFRNPKTEYLSYNPKLPTFIKAYISNGQRDVEIQLSITNGKKEYFFNGNKRQPKSLRGILPSILFCPDDLSFIKGSQSVKRNQIDATGIQLSANYYSVKKDYDKILKQKNKLLKDEIAPLYLQSVNEVLCVIGAQLCCLRSQLLKELIPYIQQYYSLLSKGKEHITIAYIPSWQQKVSDSDQQNLLDITKQDSQIALQEAILNYQQREYDSRRALFGPHADTIEFYINDKNARLFASQGQQRSLVLAFKMAEVKVLKNKLNQNPVLLLDDVMSELDKDRREQLLSLFSHETQTFITSTHKEYFTQDYLTQATIIELR